MPRQINQPVTVTLVHDDTFDGMRPASFVWRRSRFTVKAVIDQWKEVGRWWEQEVELTVWRLQCTDNGLYELSTRDGKEWRIMAIYD